MNLTTEQQAILKSPAARVSVAVSAGAGCGKTFILTQRFVDFLEPVDGRNDPLSRIVAITFTEKAGREMRHRVRAACETQLRECGDADVDYWLAVKRGLDAARITTIHAWCATLLRTYAVEAGLDPGFELLDPSFGDLFIQQVVRDAVGRLLIQKHDDARAMVARFGLEASFTMLQSLVSSVRTVDAERVNGQTPDSLAAAWSDYWREHCAPVVAEAFWKSNEVRRVVELLSQNEPSHPTMQQRRALLLATFTGEPVASVEVLDEIIASSGVQGGGLVKAWSDAEIYEQVKNALAKLKDAAKAQKKLLELGEADCRDAAAIALSVHRVIQEVAAFYADRKREESRLDFDDLLCLTRDLLRDQPHVRQRASAGIDLLMVDEFQDTDPVQTEVVRHLCGSEIGSGKLFLVGDAKQSIYRFRGADPRVFATVRNELPEAGRLPLTTNFRSQPAILRFVNELFAPAIEGYEPLVPGDPVQSSPEPCVEFLFATSDTKLNADDRRRLEARWLSRRITELLEDRTPRVLEAGSKSLRRVLPGDVAILFRTLSNIAVYEQALVEQGLDYFLSGGRAFFAQQETFDVANLCRWLEDPVDELSLAGVLRSPMFGLDDDTLLLLKPEPRASLAAGLKSPQTVSKLSERQSEQARRAAAILDELRREKDRLPLASLLTLAIERTGYDASLLCEHLGPRKLANLRKLVGLARSFDAAGPFTLGEFAARLTDAIREEAKEELAVTHPEVSDVLRLMTVHQSKGLEFPVVVLADMNWMPPHGTRSKGAYHPTLGPLLNLSNDYDGDFPNLGYEIYKVEESHASEAEQIRLLYVATTRARDHLILSAGLNDEAGKRSSWMKLLASRYDLTTSLPVVDPYLNAVSGRATPPAERSNIFVHRHEPQPAKSRKTDARTQASLARFREIVGQSELAPLPALMGAMEPDCASRAEFSVTELCKTEHRWEVDVDGLRPQTIVEGPAVESSDVDASLSEYAREVGTIAHAVIERIDFATGSYDEAAIDALVDRCILTAGGPADPRVRRRIRTAVASLLESPVAAELSEARRLHREVEFRMKWDRPGLDRPAELIGTIDCLFQDADGRWHVVDYKYVADSGRSEAEIVRQYRLQLATYALAVERMFEVHLASARLVRLGPTSLVHPVDVTPEALSAAAETIDAAIAALRNGATASSPI